MDRYILYPTEKQKAMLDKTFECCKDVHNEMLRRLIKTYRETGKMKVKASFTEDKWKYLKEVDLHAIAGEILETCSSFCAYQENQATEKPEFYTDENKCNKYSTLDLTGKEVVVTEDTISLPKIGVVKMSLNGCIPEKKKRHRVIVSSDKDDNTSNVVYSAYVFNLSDEIVR